MITNLNWVFWVFWCFLFTVLPVGLLVLYGIWSSTRLDSRTPFRPQLRTLAPRIAKSTLAWYLYTLVAVFSFSAVGLVSISDTQDKLVLAAIPTLLPTIAAISIIRLIESLLKGASWFGWVAVLPAIGCALIMPPLVLMVVSYVAWNVRRVTRGVSQQIPNK